MVETILLKMLKETFCNNNSIISVGVNKKNIKGLLVYWRNIMSVCAGRSNTSENFPQNNMVYSRDPISIEEAGA